jgi:hypothetical protein
VLHIPVSELPTSSVLNVSDRNTAFALRIVFRMQVLWTGTFDECEAAMKRFLIAGITIVVFILDVASCSRDRGNVSPPTPRTVQAAAQRKTLRAFTSDQELRSYFKELTEKQKREARLRRSPVLTLASPVAKSAAPDAMAGYADESITNVQHAGVDEGGIVKVHGDHLVVLHRGRLFTVAIGSDDLTPISSVDAFGPDIDPRGTWYDEMLVSQDTIVVIGYSYERGGTEVGLFQIDADGNLAYKSTYHLRSNDYYSSRNYASRLIGSKLIFYSPLYLNLWGGDPFDSFPAVRKWHRGATKGEFRRIVPATQIYHPEDSIDDAYGTALHTVTICDLAGKFDCKATSVIGPSGRVFYVSPQAVYVWVTGWVYTEEKAQSKSMLYRMPLDGANPSAVGVSGSPVDQFSFLESDDGYLNILVRTGSAGDGMWNAEGRTAGTALLRMPLASFSDGTQPIPASSYQKLPNLPGYALQNRFVGDYLLYGTGSGWWYPQKTNTSDLYAVRWNNGDVHKIRLLHGIDRIEQMGEAAVVVGTDGADLHFSAVSLSNSPEEMFDYVRKGASQGELRSHGFFYKPEDEDTGMLGLPISLPGRPGYGHLFQESSAILFLRNDKLRFREVGELKANPEKAKDDRCRASCVDWYGNSQPLFVRGRVIALLGYELVEGTVDNGQIQEKRRINYGPQSLAAALRTN